MKRKFMRAVGALPPPLILAALYALLILFGAILLALPIAHHTPITWSDALFTSTSAVTVTGLVVLDTGQDLTIFGQAVLAVLIQMGGLGLMTFAVLILGALGLPVGITGHHYLREDLNQSSMDQLRALVSTILKVVLICESIGALLLLAVFVPEQGLLMGAWTAIFHSVSAFNNAGFSTFAEGLVPYAADPVVNTVIPALFIIGGIGYVVLHDVFAMAQILIAQQAHARGYRDPDPLVRGNVRPAGMVEPVNAWADRQHGHAIDGQLVPGCDNPHRGFQHHRHRRSA